MVLPSKPVHICLHALYFDLHAGQDYEDLPEEGYH